MEVTKYEQLEMVNAELKLKQLLWSSIDQWEEITAEWMDVGVHYKKFLLVMR